LAEKTMIKLLYKALDHVADLLGGMIADLFGGMLAGLIFRRVWRIIGRGDDAPKPTDARQGWGEILLAAGVQGTIFALVKAAVDRGAAEGIRKLLGSWPSDEGQQPGKPAPRP
jgi:Protein of unknown function (DUF4235)